MSEWQAPLSDQQIAASAALSSFWPDKSKDEVIATYFDLIRSPEAVRRIAEWRERDAEREEEVDQVLAAARELMLPALLHVEKQYTQMPRQWPGVFRRGRSVLPLETYEEMMGSGLAQLRPRGAKSAVDGAAGTRLSRFYIEPHDLGLCVRIRRSEIEDRSYLDGLASSTLGLAESFNQSAEVLHANILNTGNIFDPRINGDGVSLFSDKHPSDRSGVYSNICKLDLNESSLEYAVQQIRAFQDDAGLRMLARPLSLIVPIELEMSAMRLFHGDAACISEKFSEGYWVLDFLTDPKAWFVKTSIPGLISMERHPFRLDILIDGASLLLEGTESYGCGYNNPRACFASYPKEAV